MVLLLIEPFSRYNAIADLGTDNDNLTTAWAIDGGTALDTTGGRYGGRVLQIQQSGRSERLRLPTVTGNVIIMGAAVKFQAEDSSIAVPVALMWGSTATSSTIHWQLDLMAGGTLILRAAGGTAIAGNIARFALTHNCWHYIEVKVDCSNVGSATVRVDGVDVITAAATDFQNGSAVFESVFLTGNHNNVWWEDAIVMDGSGATFNDFKGDMRYEAQVPDTDGATANWTPLSSTNVSNIDDALAAYDDDTTYISSAVTDQDNYASHANIVASGASTILFASLFALARADAAGDKINVQVDSGTVNRSADLALINGTYRWRWMNWIVDPNTAAAWTVANINAAVWGVRKRV